MANQLHALVSVDGNQVLVYQRINPTDGDILPKHLAIQRGKPYWLPVVKTDIDTSTGQRTKSRTEVTINADHVIKAEILEDMAPAEVDEAKDREVQRLARRAEMKLVKLQLVGIFELWKIATGGSGGANFLAWLESNADKISDSAFKAKLKDLLD